MYVWGGGGRVNVVNSHRVPCTTGYHGECVYLALLEEMDLEILSALAF